MWYSAPKENMVKIPATTLTSLVKMVMLNGKITEAVFRERLRVTLTDPNDEILLNAIPELDTTFEFAIADLKDFLKVLQSLKDDVDVSYKEGKLVLKSGKTTVRYQTAEPKTIRGEIPENNFDSIYTEMLGSKWGSFTLTRELITSLLHYKKMSPQKLTFRTDIAKRLSAHIQCEFGHEVDIEIDAKIEDSSIDEGNREFMVPVDAFFSVLSLTLADEVVYLTEKGLVVDSAGYQIALSAG